MRRALLGTCIGAVCGVLTLAGIGAQDGFTNGGLWVFGRQLPPGRQRPAWVLLFTRRTTGG